MYREEHYFKKWNNLGTCDVCNKFLHKGENMNVVRCENCNYTLHKSCIKQSDYACPGLQETIKPAYKINIGERINLFSRVKSENVTELQKKITKFNTIYQGECIINMDENKPTFNLTARAELKLLRPIKFRSDASDSTLRYSITPKIVTQGETNSNLHKSQLKRSNSYRMPNDTIISVYLVNTDDTLEIIRKLVKKCCLQSPAEKFCLYWKPKIANENTFEKIQPHEFPLVEMLDKLDLDPKCQFIMQEDESEEMTWELFSVPELTNFVSILESDCEKIIQQRRDMYNSYEKALKSLIESST